MSLQQLLGEEVPTEKVCSALLGYEKKKGEENNANSESNKSNLLEDEEDTTSTVWLQLSTLKFITNNRKLIPFKIPLKHSIIPSSYEACLIVKDPQRTYKDLVSEAGMSGVVTRVIGINKLKAKWKSFEQKRQLRDQFDLFLADDRVISMLPNVLGKTFYSKTKAPIPVHISTENADQLKKQVVSAYNATYFRASPCSSFMIRCGHTSNTSQELADNIESIVKYLCEKKVVPKGGKGISSIHVKTTQSMAVPLWNNPNLEEEVMKLRASTEEKDTSKRKPTEETKTTASPNKKAKTNASKTTEETKPAASSNKKTNTNASKTTEETKPAASPNKKTNTNASKTIEETKSSASPNKKAKTNAGKATEIKQEEKATKNDQGEGKNASPKKKVPVEKSTEKPPQKQKAIPKQKEDSAKKNNLANQPSKKNGSSDSPSKQPEQGSAQTNTTNGKKKAGKQKAKGKQ